MSGLNESWAPGQKSLVDQQQSEKHKSTTIKTLWPAWTATSSKYKWIGAYSIAPTIIGNLNCPNDEEEESRISYKLTAFITSKGNMNPGPYIEHFIFFVTHERAQ